MTRGLTKANLLTVILLLSALPAVAQEYIGCRTPDGWAETPMLRKNFVLDTNAFMHYDFQSLKFTVEVTSLGYHEVYINDARVGDCVMQPAVSQLDKHALTVTYDITDYLHKGENEIMLWLGQGWGRIYGTPAVARACVLKDVSDEECGLMTELVWSDSTWEASPSGYSYTGSWQPLQFGGERFDARVRPNWRAASVYNGMPVALKVSAQEFKGNLVVDILSPQSVDTLPDGTFLLDFGRVVTGWFQADCLPIPEGDEITMEYLDDLNTTYIEKDIYVSDGTGDDDIHFTNRFHTHSFRYVKVSGLGHYLTYGLDCPIVNGRALQISAVTPDGGATFECSDPRLNAIHDMVKYTLSNLTFSGYMVDCPHLERMGYGGDGNASTMTLQTLWDVRDTYRNWMKAWGDAMEPDGDLPYVAPAFRTGGGPYWCGFVIKAPWRTYLNYGDRHLINENYSKMKRWLEFIERISEDYILKSWHDNDSVMLRPFGRNPDWFLGDWLAPEGVDIKGESVWHVNSCFISECLADMERIAKLTGHTDDAQHYIEWRQNINAAIHRHFYHSETHTYANGTPLDQAYALMMGIPPDSTTAAKVRAQLLKDCHGKYRDHIAVGLVGVPVFTEWCIKERQTNLMATILRQEDYPGYLYMIKNGATTTWESWDGRRSHVHNCYNGIGIWFYQALAGIRPDPRQPGYKHFFIDPQPCEGVDWVRCMKPTQYGNITVEISNNGNTTTVKFTIPKGTKATFLPGSAQERTVEEGEWTFSYEK